MGFCFCGTEGLAVWKEETWEMLSVKGCVHTHAVACGAGLQPGSPTDAAACPARRCSRLGDQLPPCLPTPNPTVWGGGERGQQLDGVSQGEHPLSQMQMCLSTTHTLYTNMQKHTNLHKHPSKHKYYMFMQWDTCTYMYSHATLTHTAYTDVSPHPHVHVPSGAVPQWG